MLLGHVSDERDVALADVAVEIRPARGRVVVTRSTASGAIHAELEDGEHVVTLARDGYGTKRVRLSGQPERPVRFRLLADRLLGYVSPTWSRSGERAELRVHSVQPVRAELWRYGAAKTRVSLLGWYDEHGPRAMTQVLPDGDFTQTGTAWDETAHGHRQDAVSLTALDRSGLYYVHLETASGEFFCCPWVVAPREPTAPIAVLASTNTWNAYNRFGGRSNYINAEGLPATPTIRVRDELTRYAPREYADQLYPWQPDGEYPPLSFDRPNPDCHVDRDVRPDDPVTGRVASTLAPGLWRLLAWLEGQGAGHDLYADHQLHDGTLDLDAYRALVLDTHPEYWSTAMYDRVKSWVHERGGRLVYLGGNGVDCAVDVRSASSVRYLTQQVDPHRPDHAGLESRFHRVHESQAALLGVAFTQAGQNTAAPYAVRRADHWVFAGTGLRDGDTFGATTLHERVPGGASGHETDKVTPSSPGDVVVVAQGLNADGGGADMVYWELPGGGAVFSTGSITYVAALLVDPVVSRITANVLARFTRRA